MDTEPRRPLSGVRVVHLASLGPGPYGVMLLADLGADVVVVDRVEPMATSMPAQADPRRRGQRSIAVDVRQPHGLAVVRELITSADVLVEGMRPGAAERLGLGPGECTRLNPRLIYVRMTGWGQSGPAAARAGHDVNYLASTGVLASMGTPGAPPPVPLNLLGDYAGGGVFLAFEVLAALLDRATTGRGAVLDTAIVDGIASLSTATLGMRHAGLWGERGKNAFDGSRPWYRTYETRDGRYMAVGAIEPKFYRAFLTTMGLEPDEWQRTDALDVAELTLTLEKLFRGEDRAHWEELFAGVDACVDPVLDFDEALSRDRAQGREAYVEIAGVVQPSPLPRWLGHRAPLPAPPPGLGQDTVTVLRSLGRSEEQIAAMLECGCVSQQGRDQA